MRVDQFFAGLVVLVLAGAAQAADKGDVVHGRENRLKIVEQYEKNIPKDTIVGRKTTASVEAWSKKFLGWHYWPEHVIPAKPNIPGFKDISMTDVPTVYQIPGDEKWYMSFIGFDGRGYQSFVAESTDLIHWTNMRLAMGYGPEGRFDHGGVVLGAYLYASYDLDAPRLLKRYRGKFWSLYGAYPRQGGYDTTCSTTPWATRAAASDC